MCDDCRKNGYSVEEQKRQEEMEHLTPDQPEQGEKFPFTELGFDSKFHCPYCGSEDVIWNGERIAIKDLDRPSVSKWKGPLTHSSTFWNDHLDIDTLQDYLTRLDHRISNIERIEAFNLIKGNSGVREEK